MRPLSLTKHSVEVKLLKTGRGYLRVSDLVEEIPKWCPKEKLVHSIFRIMKECDGK